MELKHLQALVGIADHGTFSAAAEPPGHGAVQRLRPRGPAGTGAGRGAGRPGDGRLTEEGEVVVARARRILAELDAMVADVAACRQEVAGTVRVGHDRHHRPLAGPPALDLPASRPPQPPPAAWPTGQHHRSSPSWPRASSTWPSSPCRCRGDELVGPPLFEEDLMLVVPRRPPPGRTATGSYRSRPWPTWSSSSRCPGRPSATRSTRWCRPRVVPCYPPWRSTGCASSPRSPSTDTGRPSCRPRPSPHLRDRFRLLPLEGFPRRRVGVALRRRASLRRRPAP